MNVNKEKVLFICTHNAARSQMAEGLLRTLKGDRYETYSGGLEPSSVNLYAIKVMAEIGIDISDQHSKGIVGFYEMTIDHVVTVCDNAHQKCPFFAGGKNYIHKGFEDPAEFEGSEDEKLEVFRRVRDEIKDWIERTFVNGVKSTKE
ncbi:arsenate reductase ArsC [Candidatus Borrarchaeum sp.]|uniref:arsenate reductase ArsC n=1 Tax=Candidatus Borrarchaeum sp. TaxID=2846742 RepID=UPI00257F7AEB|nr:arsenate reductase ArsC [Candidatus Borrarchaeum sp.]